MPLDPSALEGGLLALFAGPPVVMAGDEIDYPASRAACAQAWADALEDYATTIVPVSAAVSAAASTLSSALAAAFATPSAIAAVDAGILAFATAVGVGMGPAFVATPPAGPPGVAAFCAVTRPTHAQAAAEFRALIDAWMRTGTATPAGGGAPVAWT